MFGIGGSVTAGSINLQATLAASSATSEAPIVPHHPITCSTGELRLFEDGSMSCGHATTPSGDPRTNFCMNHSIAILLLELAREKY